MCGAFAVINNPFTNSVTEALNVSEVETRNIRAPASNIQIIREENHKRQLCDAKWWLMLNADGKPNYKYATFNSRSDKLYSSPLTKGLFKTSRCIIPVTGFIEGQNKHYHYIQGSRGGLALGGIYKSYQFEDRSVHTASIITCPGNPKLVDIHEKSVPLILDFNDKDLMDLWLDSSYQESDIFGSLLNNTIHQDLTATPINGARDLTPRAPAMTIYAD